MEDLIGIIIFLVIFILSNLAKIKKNTKREKNGETETSSPLQTVLKFYKQNKSSDRGYYFEDVPVATKEKKLFKKKKPAKNIIKKKEYIPPKEIEKKPYKVPLATQKKQFSVNQKDLRKGVILSEILSPCLALRKRR